MKKVNEAAIMRKLDMIEAMLDRKDGSAAALLSIEPDSCPDDTDILVLRRRFVDRRSDGQSSEPLDI
jgi:hypothetical protein